jgi:hypothetical protein
MCTVFSLYPIDIYVCRYMCNSASVCLLVVINLEGGLFSFNDLDLTHLQSYFSGKRK